MDEQRLYRGKMPDGDTDIPPKSRGSVDTHKARRDLSQAVKKKVRQQWKAVMDAAWGKDEPPPPTAEEIDDRKKRALSAKAAREEEKRRATLSPQALREEDLAIALEHVAALRAQKAAARAALGGEIMMDFNDSDDAHSRVSGRSEEEEEEE